MTDLPCDTEEPRDVRETFAAMVDAKVTDLTEYRRKRIMEQQVGHDLANAFRSPAPSQSYDPIDDGGQA